MDILDGMGVSELSAKVFFKVNYSFNGMKCGKALALFACVMGHQLY